MKQDPLNFARAIIIERLLRDIPDEQRCWNVATAITNVLDMNDLIVGGVGSPNTDKAIDR